MRALRCHASTQRHARVAVSTQRSMLLIGGLRGELMYQRVVIKYPVGRAVAMRAGTMTSASCSALIGRSRLTAGRG